MVNGLLLEVNLEIRYVHFVKLGEFHIVLDISPEPNLFEIYVFSDVRCFTSTGSSHCSTDWLDVHGHSLGDVTAHASLCVISQFPVTDSAERIHKQKNLVSLGGLQPDVLKLEFGQG